MIVYVTDNLFNSPAQVLVNTVNTVGVMGKGIALEFKQIYPDMFRKYVDYCELGEIQIGKLLLYKTPHKWVLNFPTKQHWRNPSKPEYIEAGLQKFRLSYVQMGIHSIAFPALGCGNGELDFERQVRPLMEEYLSDLPIDVFIYPGRKSKEIPEHVEPERFREWLRGEPEALSFNQVWEDLQAAIGIQRQIDIPNGQDSIVVEVINEPPTLKLHNSKVSFVVEQESLLTFWRQLRDYGFSIGSLTPEEEDEIAYLTAVFSLLDYVRPVQLSSTYETLYEISSIGLQFVPALVSNRSKATQLPLVWG
jgi:O-acetyl-ADP-ribose deacetylase (regulator of RNase III)